MVKEIIFRMIITINVLVLGFVANLIAYIKGVSNETQIWFMVLSFVASIVVASYEIITSGIESIKAKTESSLTLLHSFRRVLFRLISKIELSLNEFKIETVNESFMTEIPYEEREKGSIVIGNNTWYDIEKERIDNKKRYATQYLLKLYGTMNREKIEKIVNERVL